MSPYLPKHTRASWRKQAYCQELDDEVAHQGEAVESALTSYEKQASNFSKGFQEFQQAKAQATASN
jgi:hypothetical protein